MYCVCTQPIRYMYEYQVPLAVPYTVLVRVKRFTRTLLHVPRLASWQELGTLYLYLYSMFMHALPTGTGTGTPEQ